MTKEPGPYILKSDNDGHWYVIPRARERQFDYWYWGDGIAPEWAEAVGGAPSLVLIDSYLVA